MSKNRTILFSDGSKGTSGDFPIAVIWEQEVRDQEPLYNTVIDPILEHSVYNNLFGRVMTLLEATVEPVRLKAVKDVFSKELQSWQSDSYRSAKEIADGGDSSTNIYTRGR